MFSMDFDSRQSENKEDAEIEYKFGFFDCNESYCQVWIKMNGNWFDVTELIPPRDL